MEGMMLKSAKDFDTGKLSGAKTWRGYNQTTACGLPFWSAAPSEMDIRIRDIACQLARNCRFNGALKDDVEIYSVAQHSCLVSDHCPPEFRFEGLMHDAAEAYTGDMIKPIKLQLAEWKHIETRIDLCIRRKYKLPMRMSWQVKEQDRLAVVTEHRDLQVVTGLVDWGEMPDPWPETIEPWGIFRARDEFLDRFERLRTC
jgi:uncharacterized protein